MVVLLDFNICPQVGVGESFKAKIRIARRIHPLLEDSVHIARGVVLEKILHVFRRHRLKGIRR